MTNLELLKTYNPELKDNLIVNLSFKLAVDIIKFVDKTNWGNKQFIAQQLMRSASPVGANVREAQNAESKVDFIHKFKIAAKEAEETEYWLLILKELQMDVDSLLTNAESVKKVLSKIIASTRNSLNNQRISTSNKSTN